MEWRFENIPEDQVKIIKQLHDQAKLIEILKIYKQYNVIPGTYCDNCIWSLAASQTKLFLNGQEV